MFRSIAYPTVFVVLMCCALPTRAQQVPLATTACSYTFTSGSKNTYLSYCVTANGNITQLQTPLNESFLINSEGYGLCNESPAVEYHDYASEDTGNWNPATLVGQTATSVQIARSTSDGNWTLTQTITQVAATSSIKVAMKLRNNTSTGRVAYLIRYFDGGPYGFGGSYSSSATQNSAFTWFASPATNLVGLTLQTVGTPPSGFSGGYAQDVETSPNACAFAFNSPGGVVNIFPGSVLMAYVASVPSHGSKTFTVSYKGM